MNSKSDRLEFIKTIISCKAIRSQEELLTELQKAGHSVTQATLSRDLKQLKIVKATGEYGDYAYVLPTNDMYEFIPNNAMAKNSHRNYGFVSIDFSGNLGVIRTKPGYASSMAYDIDNHHFNEILGTIAGDDTIMIVIKEGYSKEDVKQTLAQIIPNIIFY